MQDTRWYFKVAGEMMLLLTAAFWQWQGFMMSPEDERLWSKNKAFGLVSAPGIPLPLYMLTPCIKVQNKMALHGTDTILL